MSTDLSHAAWRKSTKSQNNGGCVEVADLGDHYALRDSRHPDGPVLMFTALEWECFLDGVDNGESPRR
ncbi:MAG: DUF397 domain-containing protein [Pseudonocardiales bacterium]|nr:MAG: DUF397 domain-containing protein [Pseudonocardiales bacterium]